MATEPIILKKLTFDSPRYADPDPDDTTGSVGIGVGTKDTVRITGDIVGFTEGLVEVIAIRVGIEVIGVGLRLIDGKTVILDGFGVG